MNEQQRGKLKIFMGYAAGVGKTYKMLEESRELKSQGADVVVGYFESHGRLDTIAQTAGLEIVPRKTVEYRGSAFEEMDTDAILARRPRICAVDEYPHTNVPGSGRAKRWEDVEALLDAGIDVLTTMNIQHLESLNDHVFQITGIRVRETIPDWVVEKAAEVLMIDLTPRALLHRLERGVVYGRDKAERARQFFFREETLVALREIALRQAAHEVGRQIEDGRTAAEREDGGGAPRGRDKILVLVTERPETAMVLRRARRVSDFLGAECFAVAVAPAGGGLPQSAREALDRHLNFARNLRIEARVLEAGSVATALVEFGRRNGITQIYLARPRETRWFSSLRRDMVQRIVELAKDTQIVIVSARQPASHR